MALLWNRNTGCPTHCFSLVVCRHLINPKLWSAVEETNNRGWWLPGGFVENNGDDFYTTAIKETKEEAGIDITIKGILRIENSMNKIGGRQRVIFYAEPKDFQNLEPKSIPDKESVCAKWLTIDELTKKFHNNELRGIELLHWAKYIENGGAIYPIDILVSSEDTPIPTISTPPPTSKSPTTT